MWKVMPATFVFLSKIPVRLWKVIVWVMKLHHIHCFISMLQLLWQKQQMPTRQIVTFILHFMRLYHIYNTFVLYLFIGGDTHLQVQHTPLLLHCYGCSHRWQIFCSCTPAGNSHYHGNPDADNGRQNLGWSRNAAGLYQSHCVDSRHTERPSSSKHSPQPSRKTSHTDNGNVTFKKYLTDKSDASYSVKSHKATLNG